MDLIIIVFLTLTSVPLAMFAEGPLRITLGLLFVLFFPGYTLIAALFPRKTDLDGVERLALSLGLSIVVVPLIGLALNYTIWSIRLTPILFSLAIFILAMASIAYYRRRRLTIDGRFEPRLSWVTSHLLFGWGQQGRLDRLLTVVLLLSILGALGSLGYAIAAPKIGERFTEFYILGPEGKAEGYPREVTLGSEAKITMGIVNNEYEIIVYRATVTIDGGKVNEIRDIGLDHGQRWEEDVSFRPVRMGREQKVEFTLYKGDSEELYRSLHLWIDVKGR